MAVGGHSASKCRRPRGHPGRAECGRRRAQTIACAAPPRDKRQSFIDTKTPALCRCSNSSGDLWRPRASRSGRASCCYATAPERFALLVRRGYSYKARRLSARTSVSWSRFGGDAAVRVHWPPRRISRKGTPRTPCATSSRCSPGSGRMKRAGLSIPSNRRSPRRPRRSSTHGATRSTAGSSSARCRCTPIAGRSRFASSRAGKLTRSKSSGRGRTGEDPGGSREPAPVRLFGMEHVIVNLCRSATTRSFAAGWLGTGAVRDQLPVPALQWRHHALRRQHAQTRTKFIYILIRPYYVLPTRL